MEARASSPLSGNQTFLRGTLGGLESPVAERVVAAGGDVTMVIDRHGFIRDMALGTESMAGDGVDSWLDRRWSDTVTLESKHKIDELLRDAVSHGRTRWREVNQITSAPASLMVRYVALDAGREGHVIAIGRDERVAAQMQQRLLEAQQTLERDYSRLRDAEFRYRLLFQTSSEAVLLVDGLTRRVTEANPAAERFIGDAEAPLVGKAFAKIFEPNSHDAAAALLTLTQSASQANGPETGLSSGGRSFLASASLFRQDRAPQFLVRLSPADVATRVGGDAGARLEVVLERIPDPFVLTDEEMKILAANTAFLDLVRVGSRQQTLGQSLNRFVGRSGLDRNLLLETLNEHGYVRNFNTVLRNQYDEAEDVEISAVASPNDADRCFGFTVRRATRRGGERTPAMPELRRSVEQLTELVGRVKLKELVRETTDLVERLCIEAALELTKDNRASAADILGLSRQSLYSKLHRFGLVNSAPSEN